MENPSEPTTTFYCPQCHAMITVADEIIGQRTTCPNCQAQLTVPGVPQAKAAKPQDDWFEVESDSDDSGTLRPEEIEAELGDDSALYESGNDADAWPGELARELEIELSGTDDRSQDRNVESHPGTETVAQGANPFEADPDSPMRVEGISDAILTTDQFRVTCPVCDSVMFATAAQVGKKIRCSDCHSEIDVSAPKPKTSVKSKAAPLEAPPLKEADLPLSAFPDMPGEIPPAPSDDDEGYGLEPLSEDLLRPRPQSLPIGLEGYAPSEATAPQTGGGPAKGVRPSASPATPAPQDKSSRWKETHDSTLRKPGSAYDEPLSKSVEKHEAELRHEMESVAQGPIDEGELFQWPTKFLSPFRDLNLLAYAMMVSLGLLFGYLVLDIGISILRAETEGLASYRVFGVMFVMAGAVVHLVAMLLGGVMVNQMIEAAAYKRTDFQAPELNIGEWLSSFAVVGVSLWAGMLPGVLVGNLLWATTGWFWYLVFAGATTAFVLSPIGILAAYYNGSPFKIFSPEVIATLANHSLGWMRFYSWMALWLVLFFLTFVFRYLPYLGNIFVSVGQAAVLVLVGRTIGLLAQAFINNWIADNR